MKHTALFELLGILICQTISPNINGERITRFMLVRVTANIPLVYVPVYVPSSVDPKPIYEAPLGWLSNAKFWFKSAGLTSRLKLAFYHFFAGSRCNW